MKYHFSKTKNGELIQDKFVSQQFYDNYVGASRFFDGLYGGKDKVTKSQKGTKVITFDPEGNKYIAIFVFVED